jgi:prevent-host-death family protein
MKSASITEAKNNLSALIDQVKRGRSIIITDRKQPVARLEPISARDRADDERLSLLERQGLIKRGRGKLPKEFWTMPRPKCKDGASLLQALLDERSESER